MKLPSPFKTQKQTLKRMFEDFVSNLLSTYLGDYLEGLSKSDLKLSLWKGDVELNNLVGSFLPFLMYRK